MTSASVWRRGSAPTDLRKALQFAERIEAGLVKVNQPTTGVPLHAPFGGFKHVELRELQRAGQGRRSTSTPGSRQSRSR